MQMRLEGECLLKAGDGFFVSSALFIDQAEIKVGLGESRRLADDCGEA